MELCFDGHTDLYTLQFSNLFPSEESPEASASPSPPTFCTLSQFSEWHVLLRLKTVEGFLYLRGETRLLSPTPSLTSPAARGMKRDGTPYNAVTDPDGIPIVPVHQPAHKVRASLGGQRPMEDGAGMAVEVNFEVLERGVLGLPTKKGEEPLRDVTFICEGIKTCGWFMGSVRVYVGDDELDMKQELRFLLKRYNGRRCTCCLDPVYAIGFTCDNCELTRYCSRECMARHFQQGHPMLCAHLKEKYGKRAGIVTNEVSPEMRLVGWWVESGNKYSILADANASLEMSIEYFLDVLSEGELQYRILRPKDYVASSSKSAEVPEEVVLGFTTMILKEVFYTATREGHLGLASACLYQLFRYCPSSPITWQVHTVFFTYFDYEEFEGPINSVEEYVAHTRPLRSLALLQIERALLSNISFDFWKYIKGAKEVLFSLYSIHMSEPCQNLPEMKSVVALQQVDTLILLSKVLVMVATRAPVEEAHNTLEQAEKCLQQVLQVAEVLADNRIHAISLFRLSVLLRLYKLPEKDKEAAALKSKGEELLQAKVKAIQQQGAEEEEETKKTDTK